ncbi:hypothetical protein NliqN6_2441 [Naganishia liquefaciens]|uniref:SCA7 domain-containing protein n=1 Tax=Naganishia liquefaciens TaxID=104408 RepID=A0A8H3TS76_9TREE|nr:hypothetical protein NliqN6_2441 [Naganishia liquefaciens]
MSLFRLASSPPTSPDQPFTFALPSPPAPREDALPAAPSTRFDEAGMRVFGARPMDDQGREGAVFRCPAGCGRVVAAGGLAGHVASCSVRGDPNSGARKPGAAIANGPGSGYKKGKNGLKRGESEVSPTPSETPSKKRARYSPSRSVGSVDTSFPLQVTPAASQTDLGSTTKDKSKTPGNIDSDDGRMWLENGRKETKKQMSKRLAEERRVLRREELAERDRIKAGFASGTNTAAPESLLPNPLMPKVKKVGPKPIKEYEPDKHCGVQNDLGNPCVRKLDCKIHTVGDKRNVPGRTMSFDDCLRVYRGEPPRGNEPQGAGTGFGGDSRKKARRRAQAAAEETRQRLGAFAAEDAQDEDWDAHPLAALHEFAALLDSVRRENVLLEGLVMRRAYGELAGRVAGQEIVAHGGKSGKEESIATVPPPLTSDAPKDQSTVPEPAPFGGFDFLELPPTAPAKPAKDEVTPVKSPKAGPAQTKDAPTVTPTYGPNLLARETFAGGATTGSWQFDRRRMLGAEKCFEDILSQLRGQA